MMHQHKRERHAARRMRCSDTLAFQIEQLEDLQLLSGGPIAGAISPQQISVAYGFNDITFVEMRRIGRTIIPISVSGDGTGQTIAIVEIGIDPSIENDANVFNKKYSLPALNSSNFAIYNAPGSTDDNPMNTYGFAFETSIDVEWAHAVAPGAKILLVDEGSESNPSFNDLDYGANYAANQPGVSVVSMSYGVFEFSGETQDDQYYTTPAGHAPVAFVAPSGDSAPPTTPEGQTPPSTYATTQFPADSPEVLSVGGTYFTPNGTLPKSGTHQIEDAWGEGPGQGTQGIGNASGGGISPYEPELFYTSQSQLVTSNLFGLPRFTPDVAYNAVNYSVYDTYSDTGWDIANGTSVGVPQWAALVSIADQGRALRGLPALDNLPSRIAVIDVNDPGDFHDITQGGNPFDGFNAGGGFDFVTGFGTPKAQDVVRDLVASPYQPAQPYYATGNSILLQGGILPIPPFRPVANGGSAGSSGGDLALSMGDGMLGRSNGSAELSGPFIAPLSTESSGGRIAGPPSASGATASVPAPQTATPGSDERITLEKVPGSNDSSLALADQIAIPGQSGAPAEFVSIRFAVQRGDFGFPGFSHDGNTVDAVLGDPATNDGVNLQSDGLRDTATTASAALRTQATDACFEKNTWIVDSAQLQIGTGTHAGPRRGVTPAFTVTAGILSAWFVRRRRSKKAGVNVARG